MSETIFDKLRRIRAFVFDVDGVLTDGRVHVWENGDQTRTMNVRDGFAIKRALNEGFAVCIITGGGSQGVESRLKGLGVNDIYSRVFDKTVPLTEFMNKYGLDSGDVLYMGDDVIDLGAMHLVGVKAVPTDAVVDVKKEAHFISTFPGGHGCVRDIIETTMKLQQVWKELDAGEHVGV